MDRNQKGFTLIEILVVVTIIGVLAGLVVFLIPAGTRKANIVECTNSVRQITAFLVEGRSLPKQSGVNMILHLLKRGSIATDEESVRKLFFCPGDEKDSLEGAGGLDAFKAVDIEKQGQYGRLSSYAGIDQLNRDCAASLQDPASKALVADDSQDHHIDGFVVGYTNASAQFKHKYDNWKIDINTEVRVGEGSAVDDLKCLKTDD